MKCSGSGDLSETTKKVVVENKGRLIALAKPFIPHNKISKVCNMLKMDEWFLNHLENGKLWKNGMNVQIILSHNQFIIVAVAENNYRIVVSFIYVKCIAVERRFIWNDLHSIDVGNDSWFALGDFNIIRCDAKRKGGRLRHTNAMEDFNSFINSCGLIDLPSIGNMFSWCNGYAGRAKSWDRLDR